MYFPPSFVFIQFLKNIPGTSFIPFFFFYHSLTKKKIKKIKMTSLHSAYLIQLLILSPLPNLSQFPKYLIIAIFIGLRRFPFIRTPFISRMCHFLHLPYLSVSGSQPNFALGDVFTLLVHNILSIISGFTL